MFGKERCFLRIIHTSDWHLGRFLNGYSLIEDQQHFLNWLIRVIKEEKVDLLILAGDVYNTAAPSSSAVAILDEFLKKVILELKIKVLIIAGNHDSPEKLGFSSKILETCGLFISTDLKNIKTVTVKHNKLKIGIRLLPYIPLGMAKREFNDEKINNFSETIKFVYDRYLKLHNNFDVNFLVAHGLFSYGLENSLKFCDSEVEIGGCDMANLQNFQDFSYIALGHLHRAQKIGVNARYSGSPIKYSISEAFDEKKIFIVEIFDDAKIDIQPINVDLMRDLKIKKGRFEDLLKEKTDDFVAIKLTDENFIIDPYNRLKKKFKNLLEIDFVNLKLQFKEEIKLTRNMQPKELFLNFYKYITGAEMEKEKVSFLQKVLDQLKKER